MAFHLKDGGLPIINVDNTSVLAWTLDDARAFGGKFSQMPP